MVFRWRYFLGVAALAFTLTAGAVWQGRMDGAAAIDTAGMQRMLSQRILKTYCELGLKEFYSHPQAQLAQAINLFDANLLSLESTAAGPDVKQSLAAVREVWPAYKKIALEPPSRDGAARLVELNHKLLPLAQEVVVQLEKSLGGSAGKWVNLAGRQRMLSQRMAMFYLLRLWGVETPKERDLLDAAANEYAAAVETLKTFPGNTDDTRRLIESLATSFHWLQAAMQRKETNLSFLIANTSEKMLEDADHLTGLYVKIEQQQAAARPAAVAKGE